MEFLKLVTKLLQTRRAFRRFMVVFLIVALWLAIAKEVGFMLFIIEESLQTEMFAVWQAKGQAKATVLSAYRKTLDLGWTILYAVGWLNPFAFISFRTYFESAEMFYWAAMSGLSPTSP